MADSRDKYAAERAAIIVGMLRPEGITQEEIYAILRGPRTFRQMQRIRKEIAPAMIYRFGCQRWSNIRHFIGRENYEVWAAKAKRERARRNQQQKSEKARAMRKPILEKEFLRERVSIIIRAKPPKPPKQPRALKPQTRAGVDYSRAVFTRCPSTNYDPRYQVGPGEMVPVVFRAIPLGGAL
jgi:hypothetical protein